MAFFQIDAQRCNRDWLCVRECPVGILERKSDDAPPQPRPKAELICIRCGHCVAVCPTGAFSLAEMASDQCPPLDRDLLPSLDQYAHLVRARRSIRVYRDRPVAQEDIQRLIDVARYAPTAKNSQQVSYLVINGRDKVAELAGRTIEWMRGLIKARDPLARIFGMAGLVRAWEGGIDGVLRSAPCLVVAYAPADYAGGTIDSTIALTTLELAAAAAGLGGCWAGFFMVALDKSPEVGAALDLPPGQAPYGALMLGYPKFRYWRLPLRQPARITWR